MLVVMWATCWQEGEGLLCHSPGVCHLLVWARLWHRDPFGAMTTPGQCCW